jgi:hypothetical protein
MDANQTRTKSGRWTRRLITSLVVIAVALGGSELLLRAVGLGRPTLIQRDQAAGYILEPNQSLNRFGDKIRVNSYGMRSDDLPPSKSPGVFRLLIVGDSYAYGTTMVDQANIFAEILKKELPSQIHQPVEVFNASAGGWAISNELGYVRSRGVFGADLVLLVLNQGDPTQPFAPYDPVDPFSYTVDHHPRFALQEVWDHYLIPKIFPQRYAPAHLPTPSEDEQVATQNLAYLDQLLQITRAAKTPLAVAYIPIPTAKDSPARLIAWCTEHRVPLINLTPVAAQWNANDVLTVDHAHYNTKGNRLVADQLERDWPAVMPPSTDSAPAARQ